MPDEGSEALVAKKKGLPKAPRRRTTKDSWQGVRLSVAEVFVDDGQVDNVAVEDLQVRRCGDM